jgi:hypothetical protein
MLCNLLRGNMRDEERLAERLARKLARRLERLERKRLKMHLFVQR